MIAYLSGIVATKDIEAIVLDVRGVGYGIAVSVNEHAQLVQGDKAKLYIHEHIREDAHDLYGFVSETTKQLFTQLLSVKNVGPKVALAVLGIANESAVRAAIANGDVKLLQSAKGVGKRAAEQMVVELRDKVGLIASMEAEGIVNRGGVDMNDEAVQGLVTLGYSELDAQRALSGVDKELPSEERIKQALKGSSI
jgi:holliday junction DNA helicase RuvA